MADDKSKEALNSFLNSETRQDTNKKNNDSSKKSISKKTKWIIAGATAALVIAAIVLLIVFLPKSNDTEDVIDESAAISRAVDENKEHQAEVVTDENGNIIQNGSGTLVDRDVNQVTEIDLSNPSGNYVILCETPKETTADGDDETSSTIYTIKGFEDVELQTGIPDSIANACVNIEFKSVVSTKPDLNDYGLKEPRASAVTKYDDGTTSVIYVGDDAPQSAGTYIRFGSKDTVYLIDSETASTLLTSLTGVVTLEVTPSITDADKSDFERLTLSGSNFPDKLVIKPNDDEAIKSTYIMISPETQFVNEEESSKISGGIRGLYAAEAVVVNPDSDDLKKYGLSTPYAEIEAVYADMVINLISSEPAENSVYLMEKDGNILYRVADTSVPWVSTSAEKLQNSTVLNVNREKLSSMVINENGKKYTIDIKTATDTVENEDGESEDVTTTTVYYDGKELTEDNFLTFFQNYEAMTLVDFDKTDPSSSPAMTITFNYSTGRSSDTISIDNGDSKCPVSLNGEPVGDIYSSYLTKFSKSVQEFIKGETVTSI